MRFSVGWFAVTHNLREAFPLVMGGVIQTQMNTDELPYSYSVGCKEQSLLFAALSVAALGKDETANP